MSFDFTPCAIEDVVRVTSRRHTDARGSLFERYRKTAFQRAGIATDFAQENLSVSEHGVVRGLHYQLPPHAQGKLVWVARGSIFDVAVDLRGGSETYGAWVGEELSADAGAALWIPAGFAHGYQVLSDEAVVVYKLTAEYNGEAGRGIRWDDPELGIDWPLENPILSDKDRNQPLMADADLPERGGTE